MFLHMYLYSTIAIELLLRQSSILFLGNWIWLMLNELDAYWVCIARMSRLFWKDRTLLEGSDADANQCVGFFEHQNYRLGLGLDTFY